MGAYRFIPRILLAVWSAIALAACQPAPGAPPPATRSPGAPIQATPPTLPAAAPGLVATAPTSTDLPGRWARLSELRRQVEACARSGADWGEAVEGQEIRLGGQVRTGEAAQVRLDLCEGAILRLAANSHFELLELSPAGADLQARLSLTAGQIWVGVLQGLGLVAIEVETPTGVATVRGSYMSAAYEPATGRMSITCLEGHCRLTAASGRFTDLVAGQQAEISAAGQDPSPARPMEPNQFTEWARLFPEAPTPPPLASNLPAPTATPPAAETQSVGHYVPDTTSCPSQPGTKTAPAGRAYVIAVSDGAYPDADIAQSLSFEVFLDGRSLPALEAAHADELGGQRYHVRQTFDAGQLPPGTYQVTITLTLAGPVRAYDDVTGQIVSIGPQTWAGLSGCTWIIGER